MFWSKQSKCTNFFCCTSKTPFSQYKIFQQRICSFHNSMIKFSKNIENFFQPVYPSRAEFCFCAHFPALWESSSAHPCHQMMFTLELQHWQTQSPCHKPWSPPLHWFSIAWCVCCVRICMGKKNCRGFCQKPRIQQTAATAFDSSCLPDATRKLS